MKTNIYRFGRQITLVVFAVTLLVLGACSKTPATTTTSSKTTSTQTTTTTKNTTTTQVPQLSINTTSKTGIGTYLVDGKGMTLYWTTLDSAGQSNVTGAVLANWPAFSASNVVIPTSLNASDIGSITRADGTKQTTFKRWPLYYFVQDKTAGDTLGQGVNGVWFAVNPALTAPPAPTTTASATTTTTTTITTGGNPVTINLVAQGMAFNMSTITVPAGATVTINFNNKDTVPHNFALYNNSSATPPAIFQGTTITGTSITYTFTAPTTPGTYFFRCDVHPTLMTGSFVVTAVSSGDGGGGY